MYVYLQFCSFYCAMLRSRERDYTTVCRLFVCPSVCDNYYDHFLTDDSLQYADKDQQKAVLWQGNRTMPL